MLAGAEQIHSLEESARSTLNQHDPVILYINTQELPTPPSSFFFSPFHKCSMLANVNPATKYDLWCNIRYKSLQIILSSARDELMESKEIGSQGDKPRAAGDRGDRVYSTAATKPELITAGDGLHIIQSCNKRPFIFHIELQVKTTKLIYHRFPLQGTLHSKRH